MARRPRTLPVAVALLGLGGLTGLAACSGSGHHPKAAPSPTFTAPSPTVTPTPTVAPVTCPLTGLPPSGAQNPRRPALAVKIDNVDVARPQSGVDKADIVVEELVEGGLTRLFAIYQCDSAQRIEPIRSARTSDADMLALLHGSVFAFSGANPAALPPIRKVGNTVMISADAFGGGVFHRDGARPAPHNVYASSAVLLAAGQARRRGLGAPPPLFTYGALDTSVAHAARVVALNWPAASAAWTWAGGGWQRTQNGTADVLTDGHRVSAANVVIMSIRIGSTGIRDVLGNASPLDVTVGPKRPVWVLRDGQVIRGTWERRSINTGWVLLDGHGNPLALKPGRTWVELLPSPRVPVVR